MNEKKAKSSKHSAIKEEEWDDKVSKNVIQLSLKVFNFYRFVFEINASPFLSHNRMDFSSLLK